MIGRAGLRPGASYLTPRKRRTMKRIFALLAAVAIAGSFAATAAAGGKSDTKVTIKGHNGDYYGFVKSDDVDYCANGRKVFVYELKGNGYDPHNDKKIGTDVAQANGDGYMWSIGNSGFKHGDFYSYVKKTSYCKSAFSKVISR
jgi:hypothetical protein